MGRCWNIRLTNNLKTLGFEPSHAGHCVSHKYVAGKMEAILVVHGDDLLDLTVTNEAMEMFVGELRSILNIKDLTAVLHGLPHYPRSGEKEPKG